MLKIAPKIRDDLRGIIPESTLEYLTDVGVPEHVELQGLNFLFDLSFRPELNGELFHIADVDQGFMSVVLERKTGRLGHTTPDKPEFFFSNSSIKQFIECVHAAENLWRLEKAQVVKWELRWKFLENDVRRIDPTVLDYPDNPWVTMIGELEDGVI